uniref:Uncharacterized protein n=1 Tax=Rhabditophanes sp. KR3021 TaxID=114890 RepID=A0AC35UBA4_9BILA
MRSSNLKTSLIPSDKSAFESTRKIRRSVSFSLPDDKRNKEEDVKNDSQTSESSKNPIQENLGKTRKNRDTSAGRQLKLDLIDTSSLESFPSPPTSVRTIVIPNSTMKIHIKKKVCCLQNLFI